MYCNMAERCVDDNWEKAESCGSCGSWWGLEDRPGTPKAGVKVGKAGEEEEVGSAESVPEEEVEAVDIVGIAPKAEGMERVLVGMVLVGGVQVRVGAVGERAAVVVLVGGWSSAGGW